MALNKAVKAAREASAARMVAVDVYEIAKRLRADGLDPEAALRSAESIVANHRGATVLYCHDDHCRALGCYHGWNYPCEYSPYGRVPCEQCGELYMKEDEGHRFCSERCVQAYTSSKATNAG